MSGDELRELREILMDHEKRISRLEAENSEIKEKLEGMDAKINLLIQLNKQHNNSYKWTLSLLILILSFIAAMFGLGWRPPS